MKLFKSFSVLVLVGILMLSAVGCATEEKPPAEPAKPAAQSEFLNIATGGTSGTYYPLGGALQQILNSNVEGLNATAATSGASVANVNMLSTDESQLAFIQNDIAYYAANGTEMFATGAVPTLKGLATLYTETCQFVALKSSGITSIEDLKGKRVSVGAAGSGTEANAKQILAAHGITYDDITVQYLAFGESSTGLKDGNIDAALVTAGHPTAAITELSATNEIVILPVTDAIADKLIADYPFYTKLVIPAGTYSGQTEEAATVGVKAMLAVTDAMSEDMAYNIVSALYNNLDTMKATHASVEGMSLDNAQDGMSIPLHPGAEKFFAEQK
jgi:TRAP transporter TAXI family solute receptor